MGFNHPGPWKVDLDVRNSRDQILPPRVNDAEGYTVCTVSSRQRENDERAAHLIASAPELETLLSEWLKTPFFGDKLDYENWIAAFRPRVQTALMKARGKAVVR